MPFPKRTAMSWIKGAPRLRVKGLVSRGSPSQTGWVTKSSDPGPPRRASSSARHGSESRSGRGPISERPRSASPWTKSQSIRRAAGVSVCPHHCASPSNPRTKASHSRGGLPRTRSSTRAPSSGNARWPASGSGATAVIPSAKGPRSEGSRPLVSVARRRTKPAMTRAMAGASGSRSRTGGQSRRIRQRCSLRVSASTRRPRQAETHGWRARPWACSRAPTEAADWAVAHTLNRAGRSRAVSAGPFPTKTLAARTGREEPMVVPAAPMRIWSLPAGSDMKDGESRQA